MRFADKYKVYYPQRFKGIYTSRGENDLVSVRIRQKEGRDPSKWTSKQLEALCSISDTYGNGKIHFTTRGDIELYGIHEPDLTHVIDLLDKAELDPRDSCGASVRNVMPCPSYLCPLARTDAVSVSKRISRRFRHNPQYEYPLLPKRVKITVSACDKGCATPGIMDVGIVANKNGKFDVYVGGGVGDHAFQSVKLFEGVSENDLEKISIAVADLLKAEKEKRGFKWVVNKYGLQKTKEILENMMKDIKVEDFHEETERIEAKRILRFQTRGGWLSSAEVREIAKMSEDNFDFVVLFNKQVLDVPVKGQVNTTLNYQVIRPEEYGDLKGDVESCIGNDFCPPAIVSTSTVAEGVSKVLKEEGSKLNVKISGCSHSCGRHQIGEIGLGASMRDGKPRLKIFIGGDNFRLGQEVGEVDADMYAEVIRRLSKVEDMVKSQRTDQIISLLEDIPSFTRID
ncbi:hypothetical protein [Sulfuracidifex tepidarius]|uniref:Assimilatory ferredoxin-dependent nitrite reductase n=1 Tax=Sulfuracidifex tepidarius TaxID=1294262 RepID=A0A510E5L5_9CREN|nr:hypothetical protein [Sulfuracidifex tepidarius]BBG25001.1 Assimilatory ferredoxin-dependent nitrite reductase [Sulfuracidifex tepidarius]BBG27789.1 Assimilatory ferredoxin-dependent nitrite reductase [Sulfuracidifex tepidarius]